MQINATTTVFFSGAQDTTRILTYDWTTLQYTKQSARLSGDRQLSACTLLKGAKGETLVAVASGHTQGMEAWNPADNSVVTLTSNFPLATVEYPKMISVNGNSELIFYEAYAMEGQPKGIWKYSALTGKWTKIGSMLAPRGSFNVLPVESMSCP